MFQAEWFLVIVGSKHFFVTSAGREWVWLSSVVNEEVSQKPSVQLLMFHWQKWGEMPFLEQSMEWDKNTFWLTGPHSLGWVQFLQSYCCWGEVKWVDIGASTIVLSIVLLFFKTYQKIFLNFGVITKYSVLQCFWANGWKYYL